MAAEKSYTRLGVFVVVSLAVVIGTSLFFIQRFRSRAVIPLVTYITENVSGLDVSSPVRYRGVAVGRVSEIRLDTRGDMVEVNFELFRDRLATIGATSRQIQRLSDISAIANIRARVISNPVTGEAYLLIDVPQNPPPAPTLAFTPSRPYVPSMPSPLAIAQDRLPAVLERAEETLRTLREIVARVPASLDRSDRFFTNVERILTDSHLPELSADLRKFSATATDQFAQATANIERLAGAEGSLMKFADEARRAIREADVAGSSQAGRDAADRTILAADDLRRALPAIRDALEQIRDLARRLEEQPESLVYGPRKAKGKS